MPDDRFVECFRVRTANTQDHRANVSHTYDIGYIDIESAKKQVQRGKLHIDILDQYMGKMIGAKGANLHTVIQILRENGVDVEKIILHPKTPDEMKIKLAQIKNKIEKNKQKSQGHDD